LPQTGKLKTRWHKPTRFPYFSIYLQRLNHHHPVMLVTMPEPLQSALARTLPFQVTSASFDTEPPSLRDAGYDAGAAAKRACAHFAISSGVGIFRHRTTITP